MSEWERVERAELHDPAAVKRPWLSTGVMAALFLTVLASVVGGTMWLYWWTFDYCNQLVPPDGC